MCGIYPVVWASKTNWFFTQFTVQWYLYKVLYNILLATHIWPRSQTFSVASAPTLTGLVLMRRLKSALYYKLQTIQLDKTDCLFNSFKAEAWSHEGHVYCLLSRIYFLCLSMLRNAGVRLPFGRSFSYDKVDSSQAIAPKACFKKNQNKTCRLCLEKRAGSFSSCPLLGTAFLGNLKLWPIGTC